MQAHGTSRERLQEPLVIMTSAMNAQLCERKPARGSNRTAIGGAGFTRPLRRGHPGRVASALVVSSIAISGGDIIVL